MRCADYLAGWIMIELVKRNTEVTRYSLATVGVAGQEAQSLCDDLDSNLSSVQLLLTKSKLECDTMQEEVKTVPSQIDSACSRRQDAQNASNTSVEGSKLFTSTLEIMACAITNANDAHKWTSIASFAVSGLAAIGSFFFHPLVGVAIAAGSLGVGTAINSR